MNLTPVCVHLLETRPKPCTLLKVLESEVFSNCTQTFRHGSQGFGYRVGPKVQIVAGSELLYIVVMLG